MNSHLLPDAVMTEKTADLSHCHGPVVQQVHIVTVRSHKYYYIYIYISHIITVLSYNKYTLSQSGHTSIIIYTSHIITVLSYSKYTLSHAQSGHTASIHYHSPVIQQAYNNTS